MPWALVRSVPDSFAGALTMEAPNGPIDVRLARRQHADYSGLLRSSGFEVEVVAGDERFPDSPFIEDVALVLGPVVLLTRPGAPQRRGEVEGVRRVLEGRVDLVDMSQPAYADGGDVLIVGERVFVGLSSRTNQAGFDQVARVAAAAGLVATAVRVVGGLHLKSSVVAVTPDTLLVAPGRVERGSFRGFRMIEVPDTEASAANVLPLPDGSVAVAAGYPMVRRLLEELGLRVRPIDISEFIRADGGPTCLSLRFPD